MNLKISHIVIGVLVAIAAGAYAIEMLRSDTTAAAAVAAAEPRAEHPSPIKVGHLVALDMAPLFVAKEAGFFASEGLDVETVFFANPGDNNASLAGGSIQFSTNPFTLPFLGDNRGDPMRIISSAGGLGVIQVVAQGDLEVSDLKELAAWVEGHPDRKLRVGTLRGDTLDMILYRGFDGVGLDYDDFEMLWFNDLLAMVEAFKSGEIQILSHIKPYTTELELKYGARVLTDNSEVWGVGTPNCTVAVLEDFLEEYPETVKAYLRALRRGFQLIIDDPEEAVALLSDGGYYRTSDEVLLFAFQNQPQQVVLKPNVEGMMSCINDMVAQNYIESVNARVVRTELLDEVWNEAVAGGAVGP